MAKVEGKVVKKYARALFDLCEVAELEAVRDSLIKISKVFSENKDLQSALANPAVPSNEREDALAEVVSLQEDEAKSFPSSWGAYKNFFQVLLLNSRLDLVDSVATEFSLLVDELKKNLALEITSAFDLSDSEKEDISKKIEAEVGKLSNVVWQKDESLIGGLIVKAGDKVFDNSVSGTLARLKSELSS